MNPRRLYRCRHERQLAGVAAGMAEHLDLDPTLVRILWILSAFFGGFTILLYIILAFVIPLEPATVPGPGYWQPGGSGPWQPAGPGSWQPSGSGSWQPAGPGSWQPSGSGSWQPAGPGSWQPAGSGWGAPPSQAPGAGFDPAGAGSGTPEASGALDASGGPEASDRPETSADVPDPGVAGAGVGSRPVGAAPAFGATSRPVGEAPANGGASTYGAAPAYGWATNPEWRAPWPERHTGRRRGGRAGLYLGILLIVFGALALVDAVVPGWAASGHLVPAFVVALGAVLVAGSVHRRGAEG